MNVFTRKMHAKSWKQQIHEVHPFDPKVDKRDAPSWRRTACVWWYSSLASRLSTWISVIVEIKTLTVGQLAMHMATYWTYKKQGHQLSALNYHLLKFKTLMHWTSSFVRKMILQGRSFCTISSTKKHLDFILQSHILRVRINIGINCLRVILKQLNCINKHRELHVWTTLTSSCRTLHRSIPLGFYFCSIQ